MQPFEPTAMLRAFAIAFFIAHRGVKRKSLTPHGAVAASVVGFLSISCGLRGFLLLLFYLVATKATKYKSVMKASLDETADDSACRGPSQVMACSALGVMFQIIHAVYFGKEQSIDFIEKPNQSFLACALIAHHATSLGDTLASELGILAKSQPILITSWKKVPPGTNGGVTAVGMGFSALGGLIIGAGAAIMDMLSGLSVNLVSFALFGLVCGTLGSVIDSAFGATLQVTHFDRDKKLIIQPGKESSRADSLKISGRDVLSNVQVNIISIFLSSTIGAMIGPSFFK
mmetsp:Transcript_30948/g.65296  ORF Transcript_30948/g.65296 Transcript_30948/m.65296 type:complete len:287 (-) Transcript_30948:6977-7837(-)